MESGPVMPSEVSPSRGLRSQLPVQAPSPCTRRSAAAIPPAPDDSVSRPTSTRNAACPGPTSLCRCHLLGAAEFWKELCVDTVFPAWATAVSDLRCVLLTPQ